MVKVNPEICRLRDLNSMLMNKLTEVKGLLEEAVEVSRWDIELAINIIENTLKEHE